MLTNETRRNILNRVRASGYPGGVSEAFRAAEQGIDVVDQFVQQQQLEQQQQAEQAQVQGQQMAEGNQSPPPPPPQNTPDGRVSQPNVNQPIDNNQGHLVQAGDTQNVGIQNLPTGSAQSQMIQARDGGVRHFDAGGLYHNINHKKKSGTSRSKANSTVSKKAYSNMKSGFKKKYETGGINKYGFQVSQPSTFSGTYVNDGKETPFTIPANREITGGIIDKTLLSLNKSKLDIKSKTLLGNFMKTKLDGQPIFSVPILEQSLSAAKKLGDVNLEASISRELLNAGGGNKYKLKGTKHRNNSFTEMEVEHEPDVHSRASLMHGRNFGKNKLNFNLGYSKGSGEFGESGVTGGIGYTRNFRDGGVKYETGGDIKEYEVPEDFEGEIRTGADNTLNVNPRVYRALNDVNRIINPNPKNPRTNTMSYTSRELIPHEWTTDFARRISNKKGETRSVSEIYNQLLDDRKDNKSTRSIKQRAINTALTSVDKLNDEDFQGLNAEIQNIAKGFEGVKSIPGAMKSFYNANLSGIKEYREKMGLSRKDVLKLIQPSDTATIWEKGKISAIKLGLKAKEWETGGYKQNEMKKQGGLRRYKQGGLKIKRGYIQKHPHGGEREFHFNPADFDPNYNQGSVQDNVRTPQVLQIQNEGENFIEREALLAKIAKDKKIADNQIAMNKSKGTLVNTTKKNAAIINSHSMLTNQLAGGHGGTNMRNSIEANPEKIEEIYKNTMRSSGQNTMKWNALGVASVGGAGSLNLGGATGYLNHVGRGVDLMRKANRIRPFVKGAFQSGYNATKLFALPSFYNQTGNFGVDLSTGNYDNLQKRVMDFGRGVVSTLPQLNRVKDFYKMGQDAYEGKYANAINRVIGLKAKNVGIGKGLEYYTSKVGGKFIPKSWQNLGGLPSIKSLFEKKPKTKPVSMLSSPMIKAG